MFSAKELKILFKYARLASKWLPMSLDFDQKRQQLLITRSPWRTAAFWLHLGLPLYTAGHSAVRLYMFGGRIRPSVKDPGQAEGGSAVALQWAYLALFVVWMTACVVHMVMAAYR